MLLPMETWFADCDLRFEVYPLFYTLPLLRQALFNP